MSQLHGDETNVVEKHLLIGKSEGVGNDSVQEAFKRLGFVPLKRCAQAIVTELRAPRAEDFLDPVSVA
jgi:hypothetical protein